MGKSKTSGTSEWATKNFNCCYGCLHDCIYCFAKAKQVNLKKIKPEDWHLERIRDRKVNKRYKKKFSGRIMFPSTHDITPTNLDACLTVLEKLLKVGNEVLIVSKPHLDSIEAICHQLVDYREKILFRFSIGTCDNSVLRFWEPNAPSYEERRASLQYAYDFGFKTSISAEPLLYFANIDQLLAELLPFVTDSIWIGKMNHIDKFDKYADAQTQEALTQIEAGQTDAIIKSIYLRHKHNPMIKWKESIKKVVGLPLAPQPGMDI